MSDKMRWRYGDTNPVVAAVDSTTVIEIGDLLYQATDDARPASSQADQLSESANQDEFAANFLGVAMQRSRNGDTTPVRVATTGVFEFDSISRTYELGHFVGPQEDGAGTGLEDQKVDKVGNSHMAVGRVAKREGVATTSVLIDIRSTVMTGGIEGCSPSGV